MSDVIAKRRIFSEARRKLKTIRAAVDAVQISPVTSGQDEMERRDAAKAKAKRNWELLKDATKAIVACSKETVVARRAVTLMLDNVKEHGSITLEERKFEVNKVQALCEALNKMPDPEGEEDADPPARARSERRKHVIMEVTEAAASLEANTLAESIPDVESMLLKLNELQEEFQAIEMESTAVCAMEEALDGVRIILDIAKAELDATPKEKAKLEAKRQQTWKNLMLDVELPDPPSPPPKAASPRRRDSRSGRPPSGRRPSMVEADPQKGKDAKESRSNTGELMKELLSQDEDGQEEEELGACPWSASTAAPSDTEVRPDRWSAPGTAGSVGLSDWSEWSDADGDGSASALPSRGRPLPPLPETPEPLPLREEPPWTPGTTPRERATARGTVLRRLRHKRLERRSIAALHMRRAGGRSVEAVVTWRESHGFRNPQLPRLNELWSKAGKSIEEAQGQKPCICVVCLAGPGGVTSHSRSLAKSEASHGSVRYRCAVQRWNSWRRLHSQRSVVFDGSPEGQ